MPPIRQRMTAADLGLLGLLSLLWGGSFFFNQVAVAALPPLTVVAARVMLAAAVLWAVILGRGAIVPRSRAVLVAFAGMAVLNNAIPFTLIVWGQTQIASGVAAILNASTPLFTVLLAHVLTRDERLTPGRIVGVVTGFLGVAVMMGGAALGGSGAALAAQAACVVAAVSYACASLWGRRFRALGVPPLAAAAGQLTASSLMIAPLALLVDQPWSLPAPGAAALASLVGVAVLSTSLAYAIFFRILARAGPTNLSLVTFLIPVTAILLGVGLLGETLLLRHLAGMALIGLGLAWIDGRLPAGVRARLATTWTAAVRAPRAEPARRGRSRPRG